MYTRSYGNRPQAHPRTLPPDYGGTALVIAQPEPPAPTVMVNNPPRPPRFSDRRQSRPPQKTENERSDIRRETLSRTPPLPRGRDPLAAPPFGGQGQSASPAQAQEMPSDTILTAGEGRRELPDPEQATPLGRLLDPANLKSDDLLLLGLILLFLSEGEENGRDALLLLAALYMAGL